MPAISAAERHQFPHGLLSNQLFAYEPSLAEGGQVVTPSRVNIIMPYAPIGNIIYRHKLDDQGRFIALYENDQTVPTIQRQWGEDPYSYTDTFSDGQVRKIYQTREGVWIVENQMGGRFTMHRLQEGGSVKWAFHTDDEGWNATRRSDGCLVSEEHYADEEMRFTTTTWEYDDAGRLKRVDTPYKGGRGEHYSEIYRRDMVGVCAVQAFYADLSDSTDEPKVLKILREEIREYDSQGRVIHIKRSANEPTADDFDAELEISYD